MIKIINLVKDYKNGKNSHRALNDINIDFENNGLVSILGPSGCGKTTLLNIIGGLDKATSGEIIVDDKNIENYNSKELDSYRNSEIGFIFQDINLIDHLSVYNNVDLSLVLGNVKRKERKEKVLKALKRVGLEGMEKKHPNQLSGGEQQRVAITRAIVNNPTILLADEPTGALDSKNSIEVLKILKELSKEHLVIMVTHNEELANEYSSRIIKMKDGMIESDITIESNEKIKGKEKYKKVHMPMYMSFMLSIKNLIKRFVRTLLTSFAGSVGIIAVALVLAVSGGVTAYINKVQTDSLKDYPIILRSSTVTSSAGSIYTNREQYPDTNTLLVTKSVTNYEHVNQIDNDFVEYVQEIDQSKYTIMNYSRNIKFTLVNECNDEYSSVSLSYFTEMIDNNDFMESQYDVIYGKLPTQYNEIALVVDSYNSIDIYVLMNLGLDYSKETYEFDDIVGLKYKYISNDDYYVYDESLGRFKTRGLSYQTLYNNSDVELEIVGILRENQECSFPLYDCGIVYTSALTDFVLDDANNSQIVIAQKAQGTSFDVYTGKPFKELEGSTSSQSIEYQYENKMINYGAMAPITRINIYSKTFDDRNYIESYIKEYSEYKKLHNFTYYDYMSGVSKDFSTFITILTKTLVIFGLISLFVSAIMITTITYISVIERSKEIGLMRSIGARKIDITQMFCVETGLIGILSGILGIIGAYLLRIPINNLVGNIIKNNLSLSVNNVDFVAFDFVTMLILIIGSIIITILAGLVPAIVASLKQPAKVLKGE